MKRSLNHFIALASLLMVPQIGSAADLVIPHTFVSDQPALASEVNENFADTAAAVNSKQDRVTGSCPAGQSIRVINVDGTVACEVDDAGVAGSGDITAVTTAPGSGLTGGADTGDVNLSIATDGVTEVHLAPDSVGASEITDGSVGAAEIGPSAVGASEIADASVGALEIGPNAVGSSEIATGAVGASEIATGAVGASEIATGAVGASEIADGSVGAAEIATNAVQSSEIAPDSVGSSELQSGSVTNQHLAPDVFRGRIAFSQRYVNAGVNQGDSLESVSITITGGTQLVYLSGTASLFTNSTRATACTGSICNVGIAIFDDDTDRAIGASNSFYRLNTDNGGASLSQAVVVSAPIGTHTYSVRTVFFNVNPGTMFAGHVSLTAMTVPLNGDGTAP